jgi:type VI protein secretion system component Hcp
VGPRFLLKLRAQGKSFNKVTIVFTRKDDSPTGSSSTTVMLTDVVVSSYQSGRGNPPLETFSFNFAKIEFANDIPDGGVDGSSPKVWKKAN